MQRFEQIFLTLAGDAGDGLGARERIGMAGGAAPPDGGLCALLRQIRIVVLCRSLGRIERGEVGAEIADVLVADLLDDRLHQLVLARTAAEENQLPLDELIRLAGKGGYVVGLRNAVFAMAAAATAPMRSP